MKSATLTEYFAILKALGREGPLKPAELLSIGVVGSGVLEQALVFLAKQDVIKEMSEGTESAGFVVTAKGFRLLSFFNSSFSVSRDARGAGCL